jgi:hypothetical protein
MVRLAEDKGVWVTGRSWNCVTSQRGSLYALGIGFMGPASFL